MISEDFREQLINHKRQYTDSFQKLIKIVKMPLDSKEYSIISIIGVQNSGKSTLLNHLFGTQFEVLTKQAGSRTTQGVWLSGDKGIPAIVMDVEGNDSIQNAEENNQNFEKTVAMFALTLSNLLIVNIWAKSFGTHEGTQYSILTKIIDLSIKMFKQEATKTILFCLRDFNDQIDPIEFIEGQLKKDISKIWDDIKKPANLSKHSYDRFFRVHLHTLRKYKKDNNANFLADIEELRKRLSDKTHPKYLFGEDDQKFNLPLGDLPVLSKNVWESIITNKELNLPGEKIQVSTMRCQQVRDDLLTYIESSLNQMQKNYQEALETSDGSDTANEQQLHSKIKQLEEYVDKTFTTKTANYDKNVATKGHEALTAAFKLRLDRMLNDIGKEKKDHVIKQFDKHTSKDALNNQTSLSQQLTDRIKEATAKFQRSLKIIDYPFTQKHQLAINLESTLASKLKSTQQRQAGLLQNDSETRVSRQVSERATQLTVDLETNFWQKGQTVLNELTSNLVNQYTSKYVWIYNEQPSEKQTQAIKSRVYDEFKSTLRKSLENSLIDKVLKKFNKLFTQDKEGNQHNWLVLTEQQIEHYFNAARSYSHNLIDSINNVPGFRMSTILEEREGDQLFDSSKIARLKDEAQEKMTEQYEKFLRSKKQAHLSKVPWYLWVIFVFFMYDDIWFGEDYPFIYYPIMMFLSFICMFFAIGHTKQLFSIFEFVLEKIKKKLPFLR